MNRPILAGVPQTEPSDLSGIPRRIKEALHYRGLSQSELARRIKVRPGTISSLLSGETAPSVDTLHAICRELKAQPSWVMLGVGEKWISESGSNFAPVTDVDVTTQAPIYRQHGVDQWLDDHSGELTDDERAWMQAVPWPSAHIRQPDIVYFTAVSVYRQARAAQPPSSGRGR